MFIEKYSKRGHTTPMGSNLYPRQFFYKHSMPLASGNIYRMPNSIIQFLKFVNLYLSALAAICLTWKTCKLENPL